MEKRKRTDIIERLAAYFLSLNPGDDIASVRALSRNLDASVGLISETIADIENLGGLSIDRRGHMGSFVRTIAVGKLWEIAAGEPLVIAHTLPSNRRYEGLAAALKMSLHRAGIETYFIFIRGSRTRVQALRENRCHIAITSQFAAEGLRGKDAAIAATLPPGSFAGAHNLYIRGGHSSASSDLIVAVDPDSYDQICLSKIEFKGRDIQFHQINFMNIYHYLSAGRIDAAIWTEDDMRSHLNDGIIEQPLSPHTLALTAASDTQAALLTRSADKMARQIISKIVDPNFIMDIQQKVIQGTMIPEY